ncbi:MAG: tyrosine-protein phosphatase [Phycisphaerales bacterium]
MKNSKKQLILSLIAVCFLFGGVFFVLIRNGNLLADLDDAKAIKFKDNRPTQWAIPIEQEGLPNFHKVSDVLYRGAQPDAQGIAKLKEMGIKTIVNLRSFNSDKGEIGKIEIGYEHIFFKTWHPEEKEIKRFLAIITDPSKTPVFVHCQHGADRTGLMCAIYRIAENGWTKEQALDEMMYGGFGFHAVWGNLIEYYKNLDIEKIKNSISKDK